jgi:hypothetical protein
LKKFKVAKTDLNLDNRHYPEGGTFEFDEKSETVQDLVKKRILEPEAAGTTKQSAADKASAAQAPKKP